MEETRLLLERREISRKLCHGEKFVGTVSLYLDILHLGETLLVS
jgi:hypothetical protein